MGFSANANVDASPAAPSKEVRILAKADLDDLRREGTSGLRLLHVLDTLRLDDQVIVIQLARQKFARPQKHQSGSFMGAISKLTAFASIPLREFQIINIRCGGEWRRRSNESRPRALSGSIMARFFGDAEVLADDQWGNRYDQSTSPRMTPWNEWVQRLEEEYFLVVHPCEPDALIFAEVPLEPQSPGRAPQEVDARRCALCETTIRTKAFSKHPCLFHPGTKVLAPQEESCDDDESVYDEDEHLEVFAMTCCGRLASEAGCIVEATHLAVEETDTHMEVGSICGSRPPAWRVSWRQAEIPLSEYDSEESMEPTR